MRPITSLALSLLVAASAANAQTQSPTLEERMSQADFSAAGSTSSRRRNCGR